MPQPLKELLDKWTDNPAWESLRESVLNNGKGPDHMVEVFIQTCPHTEFIPFFIRHKKEIEQYFAGKMGMM